MNTIEGIMQELGTPSLKAIATVFDLNPVRLYTVAKQPKEGEVYDAHVYNWDAIERFIARRLDAEKGLGTIEDVIKVALEKDVELKANDGRRRGNFSGDGSGAKIEVDGKMIPKRRFAHYEMENNQLIALKKDPEVYTIVMQTASHTVLRPVLAEVDENGQHPFKGNEVKVISNLMLNTKGVGAAGVEEAVKERFEGTYEVPTEK